MFHTLKSGSGTSLKTLCSRDQLEDCGITSHACQPRLWRRIHPCLPSPISFDVYLHLAHVAMHFMTDGIANLGHTSGLCHMGLNVFYNSLLLLQINIDGFHVKAHSIEINAGGLLWYRSCGKSNNIIKCQYEYTNLSTRSSSGRNIFVYVPDLMNWLLQSSSSTVYCRRSHIGSLHTQSFYLMAYGSAQILGQTLLIVF